MSITRSTHNVQVDCERVLRSLPLWFGQEGAVLAYVRDTSLLPTFVSVDAGEVNGFITLKQHAPQSFEISCLAVCASRRGGGIGRALVGSACAWVRDQGGAFLQVKTLAAAHPSPEYAQTRAFYARLGFVPLEVFSTLWSAKHPCLQLIKHLPDEH